MVHPRVLCLGEILYDCLADRVGRSLSEVESWTPYPGGAPANVACALVKLGTPAGFIGCIGEDPAGDRLVKLLEDVGVDLAGVQRHPTAPTRQVYVLRSTTGDRQFAGFGDSSPEAFADTYLQGQYLPEDLFNQVDFLVLGTLELAYPKSQQAIAFALELAHRHQVKILVDVNWRPMFWPNPTLAKAVIYPLLEQADLLKMSEEEAQWLFDTTDAAVISGQLPQATGVLITAGEQGCTYYLNGNQGQLPAFPVSAIDTTGAGDGFVAGLIHQLCQLGMASLGDAAIARQIVLYASAVGAIIATKPGAIASQPTAPEVAEFLQRNLREF